MLVAAGTAYLIVTRLVALFSRKSSAERATAASLVSPSGDSNLAKLESAVLISALASNLLPESKERLSTSAAEKIVQEFGDAGAPSARGVAARTRRLETLGRVLTALGGLAYMGVGIGGAIATRRYKDLAFPVSRILQVVGDSR